MFYYFLTMFCTLNLSYYRNFSANAVLEFIVQHEDIVNVEPSKLHITPIANNEVRSYNLSLRAVGAGHSEITSNISIDIK